MPTKGDGSIRRFVRLILDRAAAKRMERSAQEALDDATDPKRASGNLRRIERAVGRFKDVTVGAFAAIGAAIGAVFEVKAALRFGRAVFDLGAAVQETASKFRTTFGASSASLDAFIDDFGRMAGLTRRRARDMLATTGAIAQGMGATKAESAALSAEVLRLAGDFASFNNLPTTETLQAIRAALVGEREPLRRLGIVIRETDVQQQALLETGKANAENLTDQEKLYATLSLIVGKAGVQIGDLERTAASNQNRARRLGATWRSVQERFAATVTQSATVGAVIGDMTAALERLAMWIENNDHVLAGLADRLLSIAQGMGDVVAGWARILDPTGTAAADRIAAIRENLDAHDRPADRRRFLSAREAFAASDLSRLFAERGRIEGRLRETLGEDFDIAGTDIGRLSGLVGHGDVEAVERLGELRTEIGATLRVIAFLREETARLDAEARGAQPAGGPTGGKAGIGGDARSDLPEVEVEVARPAQPDLQPIDVSRLLDLPKAETAFSALEDAALDMYTQIREGAEAAGRSIAASWTDAFGRMFADIDNLEQAADQLWRSLAAGVIASVAQVAEAKAGENIAHSIEETAEGIGALATGNVAAASTHFASAAKHLAAAAAWGALAGAAAATSASVASAEPGSQAGSLAASQAAAGAAEGRDPTAPQIVIHIDGVDPDNPRHQRLIGETTREYTERYGGRIDVRRGR